MNIQVIGKDFGLRETIDIDEFGKSKITFRDINIYLRIRWTLPTNLFIFCIKNDRLFRLNWNDEVRSFQDNETFWIYKDLPESVIASQRSTRPEVTRPEVTRPEVTRPEVAEVTTRPSIMWYLLPIIGGILGGIIGYFALRDRDYVMSKNMIYLGMGILLLPYLASFVGMNNQTPIISPTPIISQDQYIPNGESIKYTYFVFISKVDDWYGFNMVRTKPIHNITYINRTLDINKSDIVIWMNDADRPLTIISKQGLWNSGESLLKIGKRFNYTFEKPGKYDFYLNEYQTGRQTIIVN